MIVTLLSIPFRFLRPKSNGYQQYWYLRFAIIVLTFVALLAFKLSGGYDGILSSEFSPIGTDERGLVVYLGTAILILTAVISFLELLFVRGRHLRM